MKKDFDIEIFRYGKEKDLKNEWGYGIHVVNATPSISTNIRFFDNHFILEEIEKPLLGESKKRLIGIEDKIDEANLRAYKYTKEIILKKFYDEALKHGYIINKVEDIVF